MLLRVTVVSCDSRTLTVFVVLPIVTVDRCDSSTLWEHLRCYWELLWLVVTAVHCDSCWGVTESYCGYLWQQYILTAVEVLLRVTVVSCDSRTLTVVEVLPRITVDICDSSTFWQVLRCYWELLSLVVTARHWQLLRCYRELLWIVVTAVHFDRCWGVTESYCG